ncbi:hypothetical protein CPB86DRAFT_49533 [Serendipita vermifera]|nr:hypothetical protein CPB86DRAFT_49533 [Serendipita vermifera]
MAGRRNPQEQISFEFTVPSQSDEYSQAQARMAASNPIPMSASRTSVQGGLNTPTASVVGRRKRDQLDDDINEDEQYERGDRSDNEEDEDEDDQGEEDDDDEWIPNSAGHSSRPSGAGSVGGNGAMGPSDRARSHPHSSQQFQHPNQRLTSSGAHALELSIPSHTTFTEGNNNNNNMLFAPEPGPHFGDSGGEGGTGSASISRRGSTSNLTKSDGKKPVKPAALGPDGLPPPKKKRRRQALSCTECKRRKIRCDRAQPCAPCSRRGEGDKCKWNILEPVLGGIPHNHHTSYRYSIVAEVLASLATTESNAILAYPQHAMFGRASLGRGLNSDSLGRSPPSRTRA